MRFDRLAVPAFGPFTDFALEFGAGKSDCHLIYGPNEAGKSSLLRAIRDLLYGIHGQTPDNFLHDYQKLKIAGRICNSAGQRLSFQRRKGNKNTLLDETGNVLPDEALAGFLGVVDRDFFTTMFGLGTEELRQGAEALLHGQGELGQALFSASLAGTPVHRILEALETEARTLFDGRARTKVSIRPAVDAYEENQRQSKAAIVRPEAWEETLTQLANAEHERGRLDAELKRDRARRDWLQRCLDALPTLGKLSEHEQRLAALPAMPDLDFEFVNTAEHALTERDQIQGTLNQLNHRIEQLENRMLENQPSAEILARAAAIESVHQQLVVYRQWKSEQVGLETDRARADSELQAGMRELGVTGEPEAVESLRVCATDELVIREAGRELDAAVQRLHDNHEEVNRIERELEKLGNNLAALPTADVTALRSALAQTAGAAEAARGLSQKNASFKAALKKLEVQHTLLKGVPAEHRATYNLRVPAAATVRQFDVELSRIDAAQAKAETDFADSGQKIKRLGDQLERLERRGALPTVSGLREARQRRDQGWDRVLAAWKDGAEEGEFDGRPLAEAYPLIVKQADSIADQLREDAEAVAQAEELRAQSRDAEVVKAEANAELEAVQATRTAWQDRWNTAWTPCGITPASPAEMLEWRDQWTAFRTCFEDWEKIHEELNTVRADIQAAELMLRPLLSNAEEQPLPALREEAERRVREADEAKGARSLLQTQEKNYMSDLEKLRSAQPELAESEKTAREAWQKQCQALGLPIQASSETSLTLLEQRRHLVGKLDAWIGLQQAVKGKRQAISAYEAGVHALADGMGLSAGTVEIQENALWVALEEARSLHARQIQSQYDLEQEVEQRPGMQESLSAAEQKVAECMTLSGSIDEPALKMVLANLRARHVIEVEIESLRQSLHLIARGEALDSFIQRVRGESGDSLTAEKDALDQAILSHEIRRDQAVQDVAKAEDVKLKLEQSGAEASDFLQAARNTAVRIRHDASRYLRLQLAVHFLRAQIEQFRKQNQAPLLAKAGKIFSSITEGSFGGLGTAFTEDDTPVLVGLRHGAEVGVNGMSDGTRDQLYLALRLAAIEHHQEHHEPMPVIMDDLLMTFDDQRARAILPILGDLGRKTQVILLTHHRHLVDLARSVLTEDGVHFHELPTGWDGGVGEIDRVETCKQ